MDFPEYEEMANEILALYNIIKSNLVTHYNKPLTAEIIDLATDQISESISDYLYRDRPRV